MKDLISGNYGLLIILRIYECRNLSECYLKKEEENS